MMRSKNVYKELTFQSRFDILVEKRTGGVSGINGKGTDMTRQKSDYVRIMLQVLAAIGGAWGLMSLYFAIHFIFLEIREPTGNVGACIFVSAMFLLMGMYLLFVCFLMLRKFSIKSITHFSGLLAILIYRFLKILLVKLTKLSLTSSL